MGKKLWPTSWITTEIKPYFVPSGVGAVLLRPRAVEADHRVFHAAHGPVDRDGRGVGIVEGVLRVDVERVANGLGRVLAPQGLGLLGIEAHGVHAPASDLVAGAVPDELARAGPGEVAHVVGGEAPGLRALGTLTLVLLGLFGRDHELGRGRGPRLVPARALFGAEHLLGVLEHAAGRHHVVLGHGDGDAVVAELQGEFAAAQVLLVLPAVDVGVGRQAREPLGHFEDAVLLRVLEHLVAGAAPDLARVVDPVVPVDRQVEVVAGMERRGQVHAHHRAHDRVGKVAAGSVAHGGDARAAVELLAPQHAPDRFERRVVEGARAGGHHRVGVRREQVHVELHPQVAQHVGGPIPVADHLGALERPRGFIELDLDRIVHLLLPVAAAGRSGRGSLLVGRRQDLLQLSELVRLGGGRARAVLAREGESEAEQRNVRDGQGEGGAAHGDRLPRFAEELSGTRVGA
jgi:hypothetical protein